MDDLAAVQALRAAVFLAEQDCPYAEEFDGNDLCSMHLLARVGVEPAGTMRLRFFAGFAKWERLCVLRRFRRAEVAEALVAEAYAITRRKGYRMVYGHAQERLLGMWRRFGFVPRNTPPFAFSDHRYIEIVAALEPAENAITLDSGPLAIIRPEGAWDSPGVLDASSGRAPTNPGG
jgi:predicted GNAT family N-acyltransferase